MRSQANPQTSRSKQTATNHPLSFAVFTTTTPKMSFSCLNLVGTSPSSSSSMFDGASSYSSTCSSSRADSTYASSQYTSESSVPSSIITRAASVSSSYTSSLSSSRKRTKSFTQPQLIHLFNNGTPIVLPSPQRQSSKLRRPTLDASCSAMEPHVHKVPASATSKAPVLRPLHPVEHCAGNIGRLDGSSVSVEVELSSEAARRAEKSIWWVRRH